MHGLSVATQMQLLRAHTLQVQSLINSLRGGNKFLIFFVIKSLYLFHTQILKDLILSDSHRIHKFAPSTKTLRTCCMIYDINSQKNQFIRNYLQFLYY